MKKILAMLIFLAFTGINISAQDSCCLRQFFIAINPFAPITGIPNQYTNLYLPLLTNLETGLSLSTGYKKGCHIPECKISYGKPNSLYTLFQFHAGYNRKWNRKSENHFFYAGGFLKYFQLNNTELNTSAFNLIPYATAGFRLNRHPFFIDFRLNQDIYAITWSNQNNTRINSDFHFSVYTDMSPVIPFLSINIGYELNPSKR